MPACLLLPSSQPPPQAKMFLLHMKWSCAFFSFLFQSFVVDGFSQVNSTMTTSYICIILLLFSVVSLLFTSFSLCDVAGVFEVSISFVRVALIVNHPFRFSDTLHLFVRYRSWKGGQSFRPQIAHPKRRYRGDFQSSSRGLQWQGVHRVILFI